MNAHLVLEKVKVLVEVLSHAPLLTNLFTINKSKTHLARLLDSLALCVCCDNYDLRRFVKKSNRVTKVGVLTFTLNLGIRLCIDLALASIKYKS